MIIGQYNVYIFKPNQFCFSDFGARVVWKPKATAQQIFDVLRPYVEENMDNIMVSDDSWSVGVLHGYGVGCFFKFFSHTFLSFNQSSF